MFENKMQVHDSYDCARHHNLANTAIYSRRAVLTQQCQVEHIKSGGKSLADHK